MSCIKRDIITVEKYRKGIVSHRAVPFLMKNKREHFNHIHYQNYGNRGITVCEEWQNNFQAFYDWAMSNGYSDELTLDRKDNDKGYSPENCRWATWHEQRINQRRCKKEL